MKHFDYYLKDVPTPQLKPEAYRVILEIMEELAELGMKEATASTAFGQVTFKIWEKS